MATSPEFLGVDATAVKQATKNNYNEANKLSVDSSMYNFSSYMAQAFGPALSESVSYAKGSESQAKLITDAAVNAAVYGNTGLTTTFGADLATYSTGGGFSTSLGTSSAGSNYTLATGTSLASAGTTTGTTAASEATMDYEQMMANMTATNTQFLAMQSMTQQESTRTTLLTNVMKAKYESHQACARNVV